MLSTHPATRANNSASDMDRYVSLNGVKLERDQVVVSPLSDAFMFGYGLFETVRVLRGQLVFLSDHLARLRQSATCLGIVCEIRTEALKIEASALLRANEMRDGVLKVMLFRDIARTSTLLVSRSNPYKQEHYDRGFRVITLQDAHVGRATAHKTTNYLPNVLARNAAHSAGADEALFVGSNGQLLEGTSTNLFAVVANKLLTPPISAGILPGVARRKILERWTGGNVSEAVITRDLLANADEVFVTNAVLGVMPVLSVDQREYPLGKYSVTPRVAQEFRTWQDQSL